MAGAARRAAAGDPLVPAGSCALIVIVAIAAWRLAEPVTLVEGLGNRGVSLDPEIYCCSFMSWQVDPIRLALSSAAIALVVVGLRRLAPVRTTLGSALIAGTCVSVSVLWMLDVVLLPAVGRPDEVLRDQPMILAWWLAWLVLPLAASVMPPPTRRA